MNAYLSSVYLMNAGSVRSQRSKSIGDDVSESGEESPDEEPPMVLEYTSPPRQDTQDDLTVTPYNPARYVGLVVSDQVRQLFEHISEYMTHEIDLPTELKPFMPEYIPAIGDIDAFIKVPRPDQIEDNLGLLVLDEPAGKQSDATVMGLQMRAAAKTSVSQGNLGVLKRIARADTNANEIDTWISNIKSVHVSKPATTVHYTKPMPDIDSLMQEWPSEFEDLLRQVDLPSADSTESLEQYVDLACSLMDIPVYKSRVQSLHVLFTLFSEFKNSQHFATLQQGESMDHQPMDNEADRLVL